MPEPSSPDALVVAHFDLPGDAIGSVVTALARRCGTPTSHSTARGTDSSGHGRERGPGELPGLVGERELPHGRIETTTMSSDNVGSGDIVVRFEEIPLAEH